MLQGRSLNLFFGLVALLACALAHANPLPDFPKNLIPNHGIVVAAALNNNRKRETPWRYLELWRDGKRYRLLPAKMGTISSAAFVGSLPEGEYRFGSVVLERRGREVSAEPLVSLPPIVVRAGRVTDLQMLTVYRFSRTKRRLALGQLRNARQANTVVDAVAPHLEELSRVPIIWNAPSLRKVGLRTQSLAVNLYGLHRAGSDWLSATRAGLLRIREKRQWRTVILPRSWEMYTATRLRSGKLVVGGEAATLLSSVDNGRTWRATSGLPATHAVIDMQQAPAGWLLVTTTDHKTVSMWRIGYLNSPQWKLLQQMPAGGDDMPRSVRVSQDLWLSQSDSGINSFSFSDNRWQRQEFIKVARLLRGRQPMAVTAGGRVLQKVRDKWKLVDQLPARKSRRDDIRFAQQRGAAYAISDIGRKARLFRKKQGEKNWTRIARLPMRYAEVFAAQDVLVTMSAGRKIYRLDGNKLTLEFTPASNKR